MVRVHAVWQWVMQRLRRRHRDVRSFAQVLKASGDLAGRADAGVATVDVQQIVGSVSRWQNLRSDFFYKTGAVTARFHRVGAAMRAGTNLPPLELYKIKRRRPPDQAPTQRSEYYVVDGHHRVAMAKQLGQDYLDAHVVEYQVTEASTASAPPATDGALPAPPSPEAPAAPPTDTTPA